jgi:hypothetical protein
MLSALSLLVERGERGAEGGAVLTGVRRLVETGGVRNSLTRAPDAAQREAKGALRPEHAGWSYALSRSKN